MDLGKLAALPGWYWDVPYVASRFPGGVPRGKLHLGGNCQLWAYEVLTHFGLGVPDLRSDELWYDTTSTIAVEVPQALDLVLYGTSNDPYGAHVGLWTGHATAHLCKEVGHPVVWRQAEFDTRHRYSVRIGFKRLVDAFKATTSLC